MLEKIQALLSYHLQAASNSLNLLCRKSLATTMTVIVIAIALTLPTLFWILTDNLEQLTTGWKKSGHISLYLQPSLSLDAQTQVVEQLRRMNEVESVSFKSSTEGLEELKKQEGMQDIMQYLPENPLPAVIEVIPALSINTAEQAKALYTRLENLPEVAQAKLDMQWINRLHAILSVVSKTTHALMVLLASAVVLIISNTLRLEIHNAHEEIQILKLIGATDPFIARPFLYSGIWYSLAGAILAVFLVNIFMLSVAIGAKQLISLYQMNYPITSLSVKQAYSLLFVAILLGWLGAKISVKRQLASIEPYN